jgi:hypothetical protein
MLQNGIRVIGSNIEAVWARLVMQKLKITELKLRECARWFHIFFLGKRVRRLLIFSVNSISRVKIPKFNL